MVLLVVRSTCKPLWLNKAIEFENSSFRGLFQFIRFIDELIDRGRDFGEENIVGPNDNVVRMMTIHSSKGLEFPFVIYSGLSKNTMKRPDSACNSKPTIRIGNGLL